MYDVIIIGAGIVGCATARELSRFQLNVLVLERESDIACGASKANSGIIHAGYDCRPGTLKAAMNVQGVALYKTLVKDLDIPYRNNGSMVLCFNESDMPRLLQLYENGQQNGVSGLSIVNGEEARRLEPNLHAEVKAALLAETAGVISPYEAAVAFAENAATNGVTFLTETTVTGITRNTHAADGENFTVATTRGSYTARTVVNAAGAESGTLHNYVNEAHENIYAQRGQYYLLDNTQRDLVTRTIFQLPTHLGKGVLVVPTVDYNILLGPTAERVDDPKDTRTTRDGLNEAVEKARLSLRTIPLSDRITAFAGVRVKHASEDFIIQETHGFIDAIGIDSPGLSAAPAIAQRIMEMVVNRLQPAENLAFVAKRTGITRFRSLPFEEQARLIRENPSYGHIVCRCETITEAEIVDAIRRPVGARNLDAIKRRTRAQMGRCQGGFCTIRLIELLSRELGLQETAITKKGADSFMLLPHTED